MLFLVLARNKENPPLPPEKNLEVVIASIEQIKKDPRTKTAYAFAGLPEGMAIVEVQSHAELNTMINSLPMSLTANFQIYPLMTFNDALKDLKQGLKMAKALKK